MLLPLLPYVPQAASVKFRKTGMIDQEMTERLIIVICGLLGKEEKYLEWPYQESILSDHFPC